MSTPPDKQDQLQQQVESLEFEKSLTSNAFFQLQNTLKKLKESEERLKNIIDATQVGTWEWNVQTGETVFNEKWAQIIGYTLEELSPVSIKTWEKFAHPDDLKQSNKLLEEHFAGTLPYYEFESRMKHKDGSWVWVIDRGHLVSRTNDGKPLKMFGTHSDITARKNNELQLKKTMDELTKMNSFMINRELKMIELKKENEKLRRG